MTEFDPTSADIRLLLVQIRESPEVAEHELASLLDVTGLNPGSVWTWNMVNEGELRWERVAAADGVIIGGAGVHSATHDDDFVPNLMDTIRRIADESKPCFGSCYGHQMIARALGGEVITDEERREVGCHDIAILEAAEGDEVFGPLWDAGVRTFPVLMGHNDRVTVLPRDGVELASSDICPNQAFRVTGVPIWCSQFHAELTPERLMERVERYADIYSPGDGTLERIKSAIRPTPEASSLFGHFLRVVAKAARTDG